MDFEVNSNPYYLETIKLFKEYYAKRQEMEQSFSPDIVQEYTELMEQYNKTAIDLLKLGVPRQIDGDLIIISIDNEDFPVQKEKIRKKIGDQQWFILFPNELEKTVGSVDEDEPQKNEQNNSQYNGFNPFIQQQQITNPFTALLSGLMMLGNSFMAPPPAPRDSGNYERQSSSNGERRDNNSALDDLSGLRRKIVMLEDERDAAKNSLSLLKQKQEKFERDSIEQVNELNNTISSMTEDMQKLNETKSVLEQKIIDMTEKENNLSCELDSAKKNLATAHNEIDNINRDMADKSNYIETLKKSVESASNNIKSKDSFIETMKKEKASLVNQIQELQKFKTDSESSFKRCEQEINSLKKQIEDNSVKAAAELKSAVENAKTSVAKEYEKRSSEAESTISSFKDKGNKDRKRIDELQSEVKKLSDDIEKKKSELSKLNKDNNILSEKVSKLQTVDTEKENFYSKLEEDNSSLKKLAYEDIKTNVMNLNAFNRDFPKIDKNTTILLMVGIRNMKVINNMQGRASGDKVISCVTNQLIQFGRENVYRILGDQFVILIRNMSQNIVMDKLNNIQYNLAGMNIDIAYGLSIGVASEDLQTFLSSAESAMNQMKMTGYSQGNQPVQQEYQQQHYSQPVIQGNMPISESSSSGMSDIPMDDLLSDYMGTEI